MLELRDIGKSYEGNPLLENVSLQIGEGETVCLLGPSGSGKSTLLRIAAGLESPDRGEVFWNGEPITRMPAHLRGFGLMFQDYALFPHLDVGENVAFGLRMKKLPRDRIHHEVREALARVNLAHYEHRRVAELSGGEQQRVALARALAPRPGLLMLDEPLGALDRALREELIEEIRRVLKSMRTPSLYVTHDQEEAFAMAARVAILHGGRIVQMGSPEAIGTEGWILLRPGGGAFTRRTTGAQKGIRGVVRESIRRKEGYRILLVDDSSWEIACSSAEPFPEGEQLVWIPAKGTWLVE
ncbi:MAG: ABC transporter ATP-binding protein [Anaerolineales bacterium]